MLDDLFFHDGKESGQVSGQKGLAGGCASDGQHGVKTDSKPIAAAQAQCRDDGAVQQSDNLKNPGPDTPRNSQENLFDHLRRTSPSINLKENQSVCAQSSHDVEGAIWILHKDLVRIGELLQLNGARLQEAFAKSATRAIRGVLVENRKRGTALSGEIAQGDWIRTEVASQQDHTLAAGDGVFEMLQAIDGSATQHFARRRAEQQKRIQPAEHGV
jgi:hypothetical protein